MCLQKDNLQRLPIHYALSNVAQAATIRLLLDACPASAHAIDQRGWTPLHVAASVGCSLPVFEQLLARNPQAASLATIQGSLPQHVLHKTNPNYVAMMRLLKDGVARSYSMPLQANDTTAKTISRCRSADEDAPSLRNERQFDSNEQSQQRDLKELLVHRSALV